MDRRISERCPMCQGPATVDSSTKELRCRRSICIQNHLSVACPRCGKADLETVSFAQGQYEYACRECTNVWAVKSAS